jgi:hypothetical protein
LDQVLDLGPLPLGNRYLPAREATEYRHPFRAGICGQCGLVQITEPVPAAELASPHGWITYREPEGHLDELAGLLRDLPGLGAGSRVLGISYKDDTTVRRLTDLGLTGGGRLDPVSDLGAVTSHLEVDGVQDLLTPARADLIAAGRGRAGLLLVRHILEHAHDTRAFARALRNLTRPDGYLVFEVPDAARSMRHGDSTVLWEEHILYFTPVTFPSSLARLGFEPVLIRRYPYPFEDSLVAVVRPGGEPQTPCAVDVPRARQGWGEFVRGLPRGRERVRERLKAELQRGGSVALLGGGHLACTWLLLCGAEDLVSFVADDDPHKQGLFMPGSRLPIRPVADLVTRGVSLCLLAVAAHSEEGVLKRNADFLARGGEFRSIFPQSVRALIPGEGAAP